MKARILAIAVGYPVLLVLVAYGLMLRDPLLLFNQVYLLGTMVVAPAALLSVVVAMARRPNAPKLSTVLALGFWVLIVTALHFWFISLMVRSL